MRLAFLLLVHACSKAPAEMPANRASITTSTVDANVSPPPPEGVEVPEFARIVEARVGDGKSAYSWYGKFAVEVRHPSVVKYREELHARRIPEGAIGELGKELYLSSVKARDRRADGYLIQDGKLEVLVKGSVDSDSDEFFEIFVGPPGG